MSEPNKLDGDTYYYAYLSEKYCPVGEEVKYYVKVDGSNYVLLAAATSDLDLDVNMSFNKRVWGCWLCYRYIFLAGEISGDGRTAGPVEFPVPCTLEVTVNSANGTLALRIVGGEDLGVVIDTLPKQQPLHLAVGTGDDECKVTLLASEPEPAEIQAQAEAAAAAAE